MIEREADGGIAVRQSSERPLHRASAEAERRELWLEADAQDARNRLQRTAEDARSRLDETRRELAETVEALEAQLAKSTPEVRDEIEGASLRPGATSASASAS